MTTFESYSRLVDELKKHDELYYVHHTPIISDEAYDHLLYQLIKIEQAHPQWVRTDSPTQRIGERPTAGFTTVKHQFPMLSLANTYTPQEVEQWINRIKKSVTNPLFCAELKMDGLALSVTYEKGRFVRAVTRGNGVEGDDVSQNIRWIRSLPLTLPSNAPESFEVRGEVFLPKSAFLQMNKERSEAGLELWANPRNAAAGSVKLLDPRESAKRPLKIIFYTLVNPSRYGLDSQAASLQWMEQLGLPVNEMFTLCHTTEEIFAYASQVLAARKQFDFEIDGIVVKLDSLSESARLGYTGKAARFAFAYKFHPEQAQTRLIDITLQVGRTGVITPVAELEPVFLAGSTIRRATLHNIEDLLEKDVRPGDAVIIEKAGDVIPQVIRAVKECRLPDSQPWIPPTHCPCCQTPLVKEEELVALYCPNPHCSEQQVRRLIFFASKAGLDIEHLGEQVMRQLFEKQLVASYKDIFLLTKEQLASLEGFKDKAIHNLLESIYNSRTLSLARLIAALGLRHVGTQTAELLGKHFSSIEALAKATKEELQAIHGVGEKTAQEVVAFFKAPTHAQEIKDLLAVGLTIQAPTFIADAFFTGKTFVLTGTLHEWTRQEAAEMIKARGGIVSDSVSKKTDYLIAGENAGSKLEKAEKLKVKILSEEDLKGRLERS